MYFFASCIDPSAASELPGLVKIRKAATQTVLLFMSFPLCCHTAGSDCQLCRTELIRERETPPARCATLVRRWMECPQNGRVKRNLRSLSQGDCPLPTMGGRGQRKPV